MLSFGILSGLLILPLIGAAFILTLRGSEEEVRANARWAALAATSITFVLSLVAWLRFDPGDPGFQLVETHAWLASNIAFKLGCRSGASNEHSIVAVNPSPKSSHPENETSTPDVASVADASTRAGVRPAAASSGARQ